MFERGDGGAGLGAALLDAAVLVTIILFWRVRWVAGALLLPSGERSAETAPQQVAATRARAQSAEAKVQQQKAIVRQAELNLQYAVSVLNAKTLRLLAFDWTYQESRDGGQTWKAADGFSGKMAMTLAQAAMPATPTAPGASLSGRTGTPLP